MYSLAGSDPVKKKIASFALFIYCTSSFNLMQFLKGIVDSKHFWIIEAESLRLNLRGKVCKSGLNIIQIYAGNISEVSVIWWIEIWLVFDDMKLTENKPSILLLLLFCAKKSLLCFISKLVTTLWQARNPHFRFLSITSPIPTIFFRKIISNITFESCHVIFQAI